MKIHKISHHGTPTILTIEEFQEEIKGKFVFLDLSENLSLRMDATPTILNLIEEGFKVSTINAKYQRCK